MKLTATDLLEQKIIDRIIPEPLGGAHKNPQQAAQNLKSTLLEELAQLAKIKPDKLIQNRIDKFGSMGPFTE